MELLELLDDGGGGPEEEHGDGGREDEHGEDVGDLGVELRLGEAVDELDDRLEEDGKLGEEVARDDEPRPADEEGARVDDEVLREGARPRGEAEGREGVADASRRTKGGHVRRQTAERIVCRQSAAVGLTRSVASREAASSSAYLALAAAR